MSKLLAEVVLNFIIDHDSDTQYGIKSEFLYDTVYKLNIKNDEIKIRDMKVSSCRVKNYAEKYWKNFNWEREEFPDDPNCNFLN